MATFNTAAKSTSTKKRSFNKFFISALIALNVLSVTNASAADSTENNLPKNTFYVEFAGTPTRHSLNYMHTFKTGNVLNYSYSIGYGMDGKNFFTPMSVNAFTSGKSHHLTAGVGVTPYIAHHQKIKRMDLDKEVFITPGMGYMFQQHHDGLFVKAGVNAQIVVDPSSRSFSAMTVNVIKPTATLSFGFSF